MLPQGLIFVVALALLMFGLQAFLTAYRRKFAGEMIKAATMMIMGLFLLYFWSTISGVGTSSGYNTRAPAYYP